jgi:hypothetical protein
MTDGPEMSDRDQALHDQLRDLMRAHGVRAYLVVTAIDQADDLTTVGTSGGTLLPDNDPDTAEVYRQMTQAAEDGIAGMRELSNVDKLTAKEKQKTSKRQWLN